MEHPLIIGAGGVASYLLPVLLKSFKPKKLTIVDKDILEERNLDRQMFTQDQVGQNKAAALIELHWKGKGPGIKVIPDWFTEVTEIPEDVDTIICCADNHMARRCAMIAADRMDIFAYIGGNEYLDSQAFAYHPSWHGTKRDPLVRYPNIAYDETGSPTACQGEAQEASPQLAVANLNCAAKLLHLMWIYDQWLVPNACNLIPSEREELIKNLPCEFFSSLTENSALY